MTEPMRPIEHDMAGHSIDWQPQVTACRPFAALVHAPGAEHCPARSIHDPLSLAPIMLVLAGGLLIAAGSMTVAGRGFGAMIKPHRRGRRSAAHAQQRRLIAGATLVVAGLYCVARIAM
jgi:hypothetical protein